jgi:hypothetical protein
VLTLCNTRRVRFATFNRVEHVAFVCEYVASWPRHKSFDMIATLRNGPFMCVHACCVV